MHGTFFCHLYKVTHFVRDDKKYIEEVGIYENSEASKYLPKSGINSLELNSRISFLRIGNKACNLCEEEKSLEHFPMACKQLETKINYVFMSKHMTGSKELTIGNTVFRTKDNIGTL